MVVHVPAPASGQHAMAPIGPVIEVISSPFGQYENATDINQQHRRQPAWSGGRRHVAVTDRGDRRDGKPGGITDAKPFEQHHCHNVQDDDDKQINEEASKLGSHPKITQRVAEIKAPVIAKSQLNFADIIAGLQKAAELADQTAQAGAMVSAWRELGKLIDAYPAERKEITMTDDIVERLQRGRLKAAEVIDINQHRKEG